MEKEIKISWNKEYVRSLNKAEFVKIFSKIYPGVDLSKEYDQIVPRKHQKKEDHGDDI